MSLERNISCDSDCAQVLMFLSLTLVQFRPSRGEMMAWTLQGRQGVATKKMAWQMVIAMVLTDLESVIRGIAGKSVRQRMPNGQEK
jgi:hypothetical protein